MYTPHLCFVIPYSLTAPLQNTLLSYYKQGYWNREDRWPFLWCTAHKWWSQDSYIDSSDLRIHILNHYIVIKGLMQVICTLWEELHSIQDGKIQRGPISRPCCSPSSSVVLWPSFSETEFPSHLSNEHKSISNLLLYSWYLWSNYFWSPFLLCLGNTLGIWRGIPYTAG